MGVYRAAKRSAKQAAKHSEPSTAFKLKQVFSFGQEPKLTGSSSEQMPPHLQSIFRAKVMNSNVDTYVHCLPASAWSLQVDGKRWVWIQSHPQVLSALQWLLLQLWLQLAELAGCLPQLWQVTPATDCYLRVHWRLVDCLPQLWQSRLQLGWWWKSHHVQSHQPVPLQLLFDLHIMEQ